MTDEDAGTRERIVRAATDMVMERGYEKTTMRAIAERAGVSLGNAYYYFAKKEDLIQGIYARIVDDHAAAARAAMRGLAGFRDRLEAALLAFLDAAEPYTAIGDRLLSLAIVPTSAVSPFSAQSGPSREKVLELYAEVVEGSDLTVDKRLREDLPDALWLMHMGLVLLWVHDRSEGKARVRALITRSLPSLDRLLRLTRNPLLRPLVNDAAEILSLLNPAALASPDTPDEADPR